MNRKLLIAGLVGAGVGMIVLTGVHGVVPFFARLPGGGKRCSACHDLHGAVRFEDLRTDAWIHLTGDVPREAWVETAGLFRSHRINDLPGVTLRDLLAEHGCAEFDRIVVVSGDGGHVALDAADLTESARLLPYLNAARLADERLHASAWLRSIIEICVVGKAPAMVVNGKPTTYGALLAGTRATVVTEPGRVAKKEESTGRMYRHVTSRLVAGVPLTSLMDPSCGQVMVTAGGQRLSFGADEVRDAVISRDKHEGHVILALPGRNRDAWPVEVTAVECE